MSDDIKKGLLGIIVDETEISKVMPEINSLTYRGYAAQDLCARCDFEEVAYLILNKELPNKKQLKEFKKELSKEITLSKNLISILKKIPKNSHKDGSSWTCDTSYYRNNAQTACMNAPANSTSPYSSNDFKCNTGYEKSENSCSKAVGVNLTSIKPKLTMFAMYAFILVFSMEFIYRKFNFKYIPK